MERDRRVQVVLGEAERTDGLLRFVLEAEGFDLVGLASNDEELARVLRGARPSVVVLDGGISVAAALDARERAAGAALVVVWPDGVSAVLAEERVEPDMVIEDLGDAVRRAVIHAHPKDAPIRVPEAAAVAPVAPGAPAEAEWIRPAPPRRKGGRRAQLLVAATTWLIVITALTAIATAVPHALEVFTGRGRERPAVDPSPARPVPDGNTPSGAIEDATPSGDTPPTACDATAKGNGADRSKGRGEADPVRTRGCRPEDRGKGGAGRDEPGGSDEPGGKGEAGGTDEPGGEGEPGGKGDPGSRGNGTGPPDGARGNGEGGGNGTLPEGRAEEGNGSAGGERGNAGHAARQEEPGPAEETGETGEKRRDAPR